MKKYMWLLLAVFVLIIIGGCGMNNEQEKNLSPSEMNAEDLPDVPALQDEFTREFIQSTEPVREGYYPFLSKSKSFTMDFPEDTVISNRAHNIGPDDRSEIITFFDNNKNKDVFIDYIFHYYKGEPNEESSKETLEKSHGKKLDFENLHTNTETNLTIAEYQPTEKLYIIPALSWNENGQIHINVTLTCHESIDSDICYNKVSKKKDDIIEILKTIDIIEN